MHSDYGHISINAASSGYRCYGAVVASTVIAPEEILRRSTPQKVVVPEQAYSSLKIDDASPMSVTPI